MEVEQAPAGRESRLGQYRLLAGAVAVVGIALIVAGELAGWDWTRIFGAILISIGGGGVGVTLGLSRPTRRRVLAGLRSTGVPIAIGIGILLTLPAVVALVSALFGIGGDAGNVSSLLLIVGFIIALVLVIATLVSLAIAFQAIRRAPATTAIGGDAGEPGVPGEERR